MSARRLWTRARVIAELRRCATRKTPLPHPIFSAGRRLFGSMKAARLAAGIGNYSAKAAPPAIAGEPTGPWSRRKVIALLKFRAARGPVILDGRTAALCARYLGGVKKARALVGFAKPPPADARPWTRDRIVEDLQRLAKAGRTLVWTELRDGIQRVFGSLAAARAAAGVDEILAKQWSTPRLRGALVVWARDRRRLPPIARRVVVERYGSIEQAFATLRIDVEPRSEGWTRSDVIDALQREAPNGEAPRSTIGNAARRLFGSVAAARIAAGVASHEQ
jgi:hypothetical protein